MNHDYSFRMMQGKGEACGHIKKEGQQIHLSLRHLPPSLPCTLYRDGCVIDTRLPSPQGVLQFTCLQDGFFFLCQERTLLLWEEGDNGSQSYFRAKRLMPKAEKKPDAKPPLPREPIGQIADTTPQPLAPPHCKEEQPLFNAPAPAGRSPSQPTPDSPVSSQTATPPAQEAQKKTPHLPITHPLPLPDDEAAVSPSSPSDKNSTLLQNTPSLAPPVLQPRTHGPSVFTLPSLRWPPALVHLQAAFHSGIPCRPFSASGFRCIKVPSKDPAIPYGIIGYKAKNSRVCTLLHAVPGHPLLPPRGFEGMPCREGHFIRIQQLPPW